MLRSLVGSEMCIRDSSYVIKQGEKGDTFYMIMKGEGVALKKNEKTGKEEIVFEYKENMYFGELSLLKEQPRAASIKTTVRFIFKNFFK